MVHHVLLLTPLHTHYWSHQLVYWYDHADDHLPNRWLIGGASIGWCAHLYVLHGPEAPDHQEGDAHLGAPVVVTKALAPVP
ncbi:hypothetical protein [Ktedonospora formicarum]|uniref:hypothetical protein n=1 Tax=Ktedonospora formicarum TaxID=2778364 RepID=UPI001C692688|nr:hypothetical protein [Ktedonospora formicarum]